MALKTIQEYLWAKAGYTGTPTKSHQQLINELVGLGGTSGKTKQQAWNLYAGTTGKTIQEAANVKVGTTGRTVQECASLL